MTYLVLGAGMMGSAVAYDLAKASRTDQVFLADIKQELAARVAHSIGDNVTPMQMDVHDRDRVFPAMSGVDVVVSAVSYSVNEELARIAIEAGVHFCDLGGNNDVVERQLAMDADARARGVTILPNCGLAPGLVNILAVTGMRQFDSVDTIQLRVGGLPQHPRPPLNYEIVFSAEGLLNEYLEPAEVIEDGRIRAVESMTGLESIAFPAPFGTMEAFHTSGGISTLTRMLEGKVRNLDYKTIRYPGHCEKFRTLLDLGFAGAEPVMIGQTVKTTRELFTELLKRKLSTGDKDLVLARATITGNSGGRHRELVYDCVDYYDESTQITSMMRTTAFPTSITARMLADGAITRRGVMTPEECVPGEQMIQELAKRGIRITTRVDEGQK
jgi:lysine 6-dehydrogenase